MEAGEEKFQEKQINYIQHLRTCFINEYLRNYHIYKNSIWHFQIMI